MSFKNLIGLAIILTSLLTSCSKSGDPSPTTSGNWVKRSEFDGSVRSEAVSFVINDTAYVATGFDGTNRLNDVWKYVSDADSWRQQVSDFPGAARNSAVAFTVGTKGYVGTGYDGVNNLKDFWQFDPATDMWTKKADFGGSARYDAVAFGIGSNGYISTGYDNSYLKDLWKYDPATDSWTQGVSMGGSKRSQAVAFVYNNKAYIATGTNNGLNVNDFWQFDPAAAEGAQWTQKRQIANVSTEGYDDTYNIIRNNAVAFVMGGNAFITTGVNSAYIKTTWMYDFTNDIWSQKSDFEGLARDGAVSFTLKDRGYIMSGKNTTMAFDDLYEFHPNEALNTND